MVSGNVLGFTRKVRACSIRICSIRWRRRSTIGIWSAQQQGRLHSQAGRLLVGRQRGFLAWAIVAVRSDAARNRYRVWRSQAPRRQYFRNYTYYANRDSTVADVEQYTFGGERALVMLEMDGDGDGARRQLGVVRAL